MDHCEGQYEKGESERIDLASGISAEVPVEQMLGSKGSPSAPINRNRHFQPGNRTAAGLLASIWEGCEI